MPRKWMYLILMTVILVSAGFGAKKEKETAPAAKWWQDAVFYQIFPYSYYDTDGDKFGDLNGITAKLDYLNYLGVTAVWLCPIHPRPEGMYHGYAVSDYYGIDPKLGTMKDFENLVKEAHKKGIKIVLDLVMNHTSLDNPWFLDSSTNKSSKYADWYLWEKTSLGWPNPTGNTKQPAWNLFNKPGIHNGHFYYAAFNMTLPDLNHANENVKKEFYKIAKFWLDKGVDGFRIDAARYVIETGPNEKQIDTPETIKYLTDFAAYCKKQNPNAYIIAEAYAGIDITSKYYAPKGGMDAVFNFEIGGKGGVIMGALQVGKPGGFLNIIKAFVSKAGVPQTFFSHFFSNHDGGRLPENLKEPEKIKAAAAMFFTVPGGAPYIYYGDEIGLMEDYEEFGDVNKRGCMMWTGDKNGGFTTNNWVWTKKMKKFYLDPAKADEKSKKEAMNLNVEYEKNDPQSVLQLFRKMIALRKKYDVLKIGDFQMISITDAMLKNPDGSDKAPQNSIVSYVRVSGKQALFFIVNTGKNPVKVQAEFQNKYFKDFAGKISVADSIWGKDLTKPVDDKTAQDVLNGKIDLEIAGRDFIVLVFQAK